jgi:hypothetical protein
VVKEEPTYRLVWRVVWWALEHFGRCRTWVRAVKANAPPPKRGALLHDRKRQLRGVKHVTFLVITQRASVVNFPRGHYKEKSACGTAVALKDRH